MNARTTWTRRAARLWPVTAVALVAAIGFAGCKSSPTAPKLRGNLTVTPTTLDFGYVAQTIRTLSFTIKAPASNNADASGSVSGNSGPFYITSGAGDYKLSPGDSLVVTVRFSATGAASRESCTIETGPNAPNVTCKGVIQEWAYMLIEPVSSSKFHWQTNYSAFGTPSVSLHNTTYEEPSWSACKGWRVQGSPLEENGVTIGNLHVPGSAKTLSIHSNRDAEDACDQNEVLVQLDGNREHYFTAPLYCSGASMDVSWPFGTGTHSVVIGMNQSGNALCWADVVFDKFYMIFEGVPVSPSASSAMAVSGAGDVFGGTGDVTISNAPLEN